eukprot:768598-Hanusia_phi.AAC.2
MMGQHCFACWLPLASPWGHSGKSHKVCVVLRLADQNHDNGQTFCQLISLHAIRLSSLLQWAGYENQIPSEVKTHRHTFQSTRGEEEARPALLLLAWKEDHDLSGFIVNAIISLEGRAANDCTIIRRHIDCGRPFSFHCVLQWMVRDVMPQQSVSRFLFILRAHTSDQRSMLTGMKSSFPYPWHLTTSGTSPLGAFGVQ